MEMFSLLALSALLVVAGGAATFATAVLLPQALVDRAQRHGRFFGLEASQGRTGGGSGRRRRAMAPIFGVLQAI